MSDLKRYLAVKTKVDTLNRKVERAKGALENELSRLKKEFGAKSFEEAKQILAQLESERNKAKKKFEAELSRFEEKWSDKL